MGDDWGKICADFKQKKQEPIEEEIPRRRKKGGQTKPFVVEYRPMDGEKVFSWESWKSDEWRNWRRYREREDAEKAMKQLPKSSTYFSRYQFRLKEE